MKNEIIIYQNEYASTKIEVRLEDETVWLTIEQIGVLFGRDRTVINRHINNIFKEGELDRKVVCAIFALTTQHGAIKSKSQSKNVEHYNLDVIISVGYRVKSKQGTLFRIWANKVLRDYLLKGYAFSNRIIRIEDDVHYLKEKAKEFDLQLKTNLPPHEGIFYDGQVFDAYVFVADIIKSAKKKHIANRQLHCRICLGFAIKTAKKRECYNLYKINFKAVGTRHQKAQSTISRNRGKSICKIARQVSYSRQSNNLSYWSFVKRFGQKLGCVCKDGNG